MALRRRGWEGHKLMRGNSSKCVAVSSLGMVVVPIRVTAVGIERMGGFKICFEGRFC